MTCFAQVCRFFEAALEAEQLVLPKLANIVLYLDLECGVEDSEQSAQGVCVALGKLKAAGILPALSQARRFPRTGA